MKFYLQKVKNGVEIVTTEYDPPRYSNPYSGGEEVPVQDPTGSNIKDRWGDDYGNRVDRFLACVAFLDGTTLRDAATGEILWQVRSGDDVGRCMGTDIHAGYRGMEMWSSRSGGIVNADSLKTVNTSTSSVSMNMACCVLPPTVLSAFT